MTAPARIRFAIVGLGKMALDQHIPSLAASDEFELIAVASPDHGVTSSLRSIGAGNCALMLLNRAKLASKWQGIF